MSIELLCENTGETTTDTVENTANNDTSWRHRLPNGILQERLNILAKCDCCVGHNINKPRKFIDWWITIFDDHFNDNECNCECDCRHLARRLCYEKWLFINSPTCINRETYKSSL